MDALAADGSVIATRTVRWLALFARYTKPGVYPGA
jgi:hypothetical protein